MISDERILMKDDGQNHDYVQSFVQYLKYSCSMFKRRRCRVAFCALKFMSLDDIFLLWFSFQSYFVESVCAFEI